MKLKGVSFRHAVELLKDDSVLAAGSVGAGGEPVKRSTVRTLPPPVSLDADDRALLLQVVDSSLLRTTQPTILRLYRSRIRSK